MRSSRRSTTCRSRSSPTRITRSPSTYGVWVEKTYDGKTYMGVERSTFVIDADGNVAKVFRKVKPDRHADQVLDALRSTRARGSG